MGAVIATMPTSFLPDNDQWKHRFEIRGSSGSTYIVSQKKTDETWGCSCPGWRHNRHCKHLDAYQTILSKIARGGVSLPEREAEKFGPVAERRRVKSEEREEEPSICGAAVLRGGRAARCGVRDCSVHAEV